MANGEGIYLDAHEKEEVWKALWENVKEYAASSDDERVRIASLVWDGFPSRVRQSVRDTRLGLRSDNVLLLRGLIPDLLPIEPTPSSLYAKSRDRVTLACEMLLISIAVGFGEPFSFRSLYEGRMVQYVLPVPGQETAQTSGGSQTDLDWHVEDAFTEDRCDYFGLLCLRGEAGAKTTYAPVSAMTFSSETEALIREPRFEVIADEAHHSDQPGVTIPILSGPPSDPRITFDPIYMRPADRRDQSAIEGMQAVLDQVRSSAKSVELSSGDVLVIDNRRVVHGRTAFQPRYDGSDRWLLRTMVCGDMNKHRDREKARAI